MGEAVRLFLRAALGSQCATFATFVLDVLLTLFQKHSPWGKGSAGDVSTQKDWQSYEKLKMGLKRTHFRQLSAEIPLLILFRRDMTYTVHVIFEAPQPIF